MRLDNVKAPKAAKLTAWAARFKPTETSPYTSPASLPEALLDEPKLYRVLLLNDDWTAMDFVVSVLMEVFDKSADEATAIMLKVHNEGKGVCGIYTYDIAELKTHIVKEKAQHHGYPLRVITEEAP